MATKEQNQDQDEDQDQEQVHDQEQVPGEGTGEKGQLGALLQGQGLIYPLQSALMMIEPGHFYPRKASSVFAGRPICTSPLLGAQRLLIHS